METAVCGLTGVVKFNKKLENYNYYRYFLNSVSHRGRDDEGYIAMNTSNRSTLKMFGKYSVNKSLSQNIEESDITPYNVLLHHNRLSIIDLTQNGHQPMYFKGKWIIFNGEIYNYIEIRTELINIGYKFDTKSDTEVILKAYDHWGNSAFNMFNGEWAIVIYDESNKEITLCRDRYGIKPLYYYCQDKDIYFSSEIKSFKYLNLKIRLDEKQFYKYVENSIVNDSCNTIINNLYQIMPGHMMKYKLDNGDNSIHKYYQLKRRKTYREINNSDVIDCFNYLLTSAVRLRLRSDVPVSFAMSGGLDSTTLVAIAVEKLRISPTTFSVVFAGEECDEKNDIQEMQALYNLNSNLINIQSVEMDRINKLITNQDQPFLGLSIYAQNMLYTRAHEMNYKIMISGQGADEVLGGYSKYINAAYLEKHIIRSKEAISYLIASKVPIVNQVLNTRSKNRISRRIVENNRYIVDSEKYRYLHSLRNIPLFRREIIKTIEKDILPQLLHYEDRNSMGNTMEGRYPFLDHRVVEFLASLSSDNQFDMKDDLRKIILRRINTERLPSKILHQKGKNGFQVPQGKWLREHHKYIVNEINLNTRLSNYFENNFIERTIRNYENRNRKCEFENDIWMLFNFSKWMREYLI